MANDAKLDLSFEIFSGDSALRSETLSAESVTIGRGPAAMLRIEDDSLADLHAVVNINDSGTVQILDLGGAAGTQVNGKSVSNSTLDAGDERSPWAISESLSASVRLLKKRLHP